MNPPAGLFTNLPQRPQSPFAIPPIALYRLTAVPSDHDMNRRPCIFNPYWALKTAIHAVALPPVLLARNVQ